MAQDSARASHQKKFTPLGIVFTVAGVLLFAYFVRKAGVGQILDGIKKLGFGFVLIIAISSIRSVSSRGCFVLMGRSACGFGTRCAGV